MGQEHHFGYCEDDGWQAVELPYEGQQVSMVVLLPTAGRFNEFASWLNAERLAKIVSELGRRQVVLSLPRFTLTSKLSLGDSLRALGARDAFAAGQADFSGMDGSRELFIGGVLHKAFVKVDEAGTEAAAATAVVMVGSAMPVQPPAVFNADRPFLFVIRDVPTGQILFWGRVLNPLG